MKIYLKKSALVLAMLHTGSIHALNSALGVDDGEFDEVTKKYFLPSEKMEDPGQTVINKGEYLVKNQETEKFRVVSADEFEKDYVLESLENDVETVSETESLGTSDAEGPAETYEEEGSEKAE